MDNIYGFMKKWAHIDLGQVFTPVHMARFAAKLIDINKDDVVLDSSAGTGALLFVALEREAKAVYGIEFDKDVCDKLKENLKQTDAVFDVINADASSEKAAEWINSKGITKAILNPPYEKKYNSAEIVLNTLNSLPAGCLVAMFHQTNFFEKLTNKQKAEMQKHRVEKVIQMPSNLFKPFVSVQTNLFIIRTNTPQNDYKFYGYKIEDDGLKRAKGKYREDRDGTWQNELEPRYFDIISNEKDDDISTRQDPLQGFMYQKKIDLTPTYEDFRSTVENYLDFKISEYFLGNQNKNGIFPHDLRLSSCQLKMAALAYFIGINNVLPLLDNEGQFAAEQKTEEPNLSDHFTYEEFVQKFSQEEIDQYSNEILSGLVKKPDVILEYIKIGLINDGKFDFKKCSERMNGYVPIMKKTQPAWDYMRDYITGIEQDTLVEIVKYKQAMLENIKNYNEQKQQLTKQ